MQVVGGEFVTMSVKSLTVRNQEEKLLISPVAFTDLVKDGGERGEA